MTEHQGASCPLCEELIGPDGACTWIDCEFVACPFCPPVDGMAVGAPVLDRGHEATACEHLVLMRCGEVETAALIGSIGGIPDAVLVPPPETWFDEALDAADPWAFARAEGLPAEDMPDLSPEQWTTHMLEWIGEAVADRQGAVQRSSRFGTASSWVSDPKAFWREVEGHITRLKEWHWDPQ
jgi:hypothetical protein